jgi:hypothetical protein
MLGFSSSPPQKKGIKKPSKNMMNAMEKGDRSRDASYQCTCSFTLAVPAAKAT